jgi:ELWxxDGT repeat protein
MKLPSRTADTIRRRTQQALRTRDLRTAFRNTAGAIDLASIMVGVIVIGVIAGIIAATVFTVIPWSQDAAAKQSLSAVREAESVAFTQGAEGGASKYQDKIRLLDSKLIQDSAKVGIATDADGTCYVGVSKSSTGNVYYVTDKMITATLLTATTDPGCLTPAELTSLIATVGGSSTGTASIGTASVPGGLPTVLVDSFDATYNNEFVYAFNGTSVTNIGSPSWSPVAMPTVDNGRGSASGVTYNGSFYFAASSNVDATDQELWVYDGVTTKMVTDIHTGSYNGSAPSNLIVFKDKLWFTAINGTTWDLWSYDGVTAVNTRTTVPSIADTLGSQPSLTILGDKMYYVGFDAVNGYELWSFDGTTATMTGAVIPGNSADRTVRLTNLTVAGSVLYYVAPSVVAANGLATEQAVYQYAGTRSSTLSALPLGYGSNGPSQLTALGAKVYLSARDLSTNKDVLWKLDSTSATIVPGPTAPYLQSPVGFGVMGGKVYFGAVDSASRGNELYSYDGTASALVADIRTDIDAWGDGYGSYPVVMGVTQNRVFINAETAGSGVEAFVYDGSTTTLIDIRPGTTSSFPTWLGSTGDTAILQANDSTGSSSLWSYTGTTLSSVKPGFASPRGMGTFN